MGTERTGVVPSRYFLDLDDVRSEVGEEHSRGWTSQHACQVDNLDAFEGRRDAFCAATTSWDACLVQSPAGYIAQDRALPAYVSQVSE